MVDLPQNSPPQNRGGLATLALGIFASLLASAGQMIFPGHLVMWEGIFYASMAGVLLSIAYLIYINGGIAKAALRNQDLRLLCLFY